MAEVPPTPLERMARGEDLQQHGEEGSSSSKNSNGDDKSAPLSLSDEELQLQGDAICEAVRWLMAAEEKDRTIEAAEAILVRARMSEVQQCKSVVAFIDDEVAARTATIALIQTQIAQLGEFAAMAMAQQQQQMAQLGGGSEVSFYGGANHPHGHGASFAAGNSFGHAQQQQQQSLFGGLYSGEGSSELTEGAEDGRRPLDTASPAPQQPPISFGLAQSHGGGSVPPNPLSPGPYQQQQRQRGGLAPPLPAAGPTPSLSPARQKMLAFALSNHAGNANLRGVGGAAARRGGGTALREGPNGGRDEQPTALAAADEILNSVAASAGSLTLASVRASTAHVGIGAGGEAYATYGQQPHPLRERRSAALDAKVQARLDRIMAIGGNDV